ncbi:hypothetical protein [Polaribacter aestuariivivens]|uniref:hypothetical protein n=1 Tax=Polaribacter aestuariivivens TaxID=2304626 RepID=UPI003F497C0B
MKNNLLFLATMLYSFVCFGQITNSNKKIIGQYYDAVNSQVKFNSKNIELTIRIDSSWTKYVVGKEDNLERSAIKVNSHFFSFGLVSSEDFSDLDAVKSKNLGFRFGYQFQNAFDKIYMDSTYSRVVYKKYNTLIVGTKLGVDRFQNFNPQSSKIESAVPFVANISLGWNKYYFSNNPNGSGFSTVFSLNGQVNIFDYKKLKDFYNDTDVTINGNILVPTESFAGKFGTLDNNARGGYFSVATSFVSNKKLKIRDTELFHFAPMMHLSWQSFAGKSPIYNAGFSFGFLNSGFFGEKKEEKYKIGNKEKTAYYQKFKAPSLLSLGIDWNYIGGADNKPQYYISGTINF